MHNFIRYLSPPILLFLPGRLVQGFASDDWRAWLPPAGWKCESIWKDPGHWQTVDVTAHGLRPNDASVDAAVVVKGILDRTSGNRILFFPKGDYWFRSPCSLGTSNTIIRGAGMDQTRFFQDIAGKGNLGFRGSIGEKPIPLTGKMPQRGDEWLSIEDADTLEVGDFIKLFQANPNTEGPFGYLAEFCWSQILQVVEKDGQRIRVDMKLGLDYQASQHPRIVRMQMVQNVGLENFYIEKLQDNDDFTLFFYGVFNGYMRSIRSKNTSRAHFQVRESRRVLVADNEAELSWDYGGKGHGYGVVFADNATQCYAFNNACGSMRHPFHIQRGANHCVFAYNYSWEGEVKERGSQPHDCRLHGGWVNNNLIEGNVAHVWFADAINGVNGPYNFWFRNKTYFGNYQFGTHWVAIGNLFTRQEQVPPDGPNDFAGANMGFDGTVIWGRIPEQEQLPNSLCFQQQPPFLAQAWPVFGPGAGDDWGRSNTIPAEANALP